MVRSGRGSLQDLSQSLVVCFLGASYVVQNFNHLCILIMSLQVMLVMMVGGRSMRSRGCWVAVSSSWLVITVITVLAVVQLHVMVADALLSGTQMPPSQLLKVWFDCSSFVWDGRSAAEIKLLLLCFCCLHFGSTKFLKEH